MKIKRYFGDKAAFLSALLLALGAFGIPAFAQEAQVLSASPAMASASDATFSGLQIRSEDEIRAYYQANPFQKTGGETWQIPPDAGREIAGVLSGESRQNILHAFNFIRYTAGLEEVSYNTETEKYAQAASTLLIRVGSLTHYPPRPSGVSDAFYQLGSEGASTSNLGMGYRNLAHALVQGWMNDGDPSNIEAVGHRRWCLNPRMRSVSFGLSGSFSAMHVMDPQRASFDDIRYLPWPAQVMPVEYFFGPWSVSVNSSYYAISDHPVVTMTELGTGAQYQIGTGDKNKSGKYMTVSRGGYGSGHCLIFKPGVNFKAGDRIHIRIQGIKDAAGNDTEIEYEVSFFSLQGGGSTQDTSLGGSGGGSGGRSGGGSAARTQKDVTGVRTYRTGKSEEDLLRQLPAYVVTGKWELAEAGWKFADHKGKGYAGRWAAVYNPYANRALGQPIFDWFSFDEKGLMRTGWFRDDDGSYYYLNPESDGTRGCMVTGWRWIADESGRKKCYYFNTISDGHRGRMLSDTMIDGYRINSRGEWEENGIVQIR